MRLTRLTTAVVEANYDWTIVRAESDEGLVGWGEAFCAPGLPETIRELAPLIEGRDARHVEPLVRRLHLATAHVSGGGTVFHAISGIEAALWDLVARSLDVPLWQLFGGCFRDRVRIYADCHAGDALTSYGATLVARHLPWMGADEPSEKDPEEHWAPAEAGDVYTPEAYAARASSMADRGFTALKFDLDLPLLRVKISTREPSRAAADGQAGRARRGNGRGGCRQSRRRLRPALALRARGRASARSLARALARSSGSRIRRRLRTSPPSRASPSGPRPRSAPARTSTASTASPRSWPQAAWTSSLRTSRRSEGFQRRS